MTIAHSTPDCVPAWLRLIARNRRLEDYQGLVASDGQQALAQIEQYVPDLVLLDLGADDYLTKPFSIEELLAGCGGAQAGAIRRDRVCAAPGEDGPARD